MRSTHVRTLWVADGPTCSGRWAGRGGSAHGRDARGPLTSWSDVSPARAYRIPNSVPNTERPKMDCIPWVRMFAVVSPGGEKAVTTARLRTRPDGVAPRRWPPSTFVRLGPQNPLHHWPFLGGEPAGCRHRVQPRASDLPGSTFPSSGSGSTRPEPSSAPTQTSRGPRSGARHPVGGNPVPQTHQIRMLSRRQR
jgi:hypothetical protein